MAAGNTTTIFSVNSLANAATDNIVRLENVDNGRPCTIAVVGDPGSVYSVNIDDADTGESLSAPSGIGGVYVFSLPTDGINGIINRLDPATGGATFDNHPGCAKRRPSGVRIRTSAGGVGLVVRARVFGAILNP